MRDGKFRFVLNVLVIRIPHCADDSRLPRPYFDLDANIFPSYCCGSYGFSCRFLCCKPSSEPFDKAFGARIYSVVLVLPVGVSAQQITKFERVEYPFRERQKVVALSLADQSMYSRKVDEVGSDAQRIWESNLAHLMIQSARGHIATPAER